MAQERGSAHVGATAVMMMLSMAMLFHSQVADATVYTVGDTNGGWNLNVGNWTRGKKFKASDTLVFKYTDRQHNVVSVNSSNYNNCNSVGKKYDTGNDSIPLAKGHNYFICGISGHCVAGMKINVTAM